MIDQWSDDGTGWARFSDDMTMRFRLARSLRDWPMVVIDDQVWLMNEGGPAPLPLRVVFLMLNPSTANAFVLDPTVNECRKRAIALGADVLEVVNLFALRSPYPADLRKRAAGSRGDDHENNHAIIEACTGAFRVIAAWGNDGELGGRAALVRELLAHERIELHHLGLTAGGCPKHPLARGKHRIPAELAPALWIRSAA